MLEKLTHTAMALALVVGTSVVTAPQAEAHRRGGGAAGLVAGTIIGLGILGAYAASRDRDYYAPNYYSGGACYPGRPVCRVVGQLCGYNRYGEYRCRDDVRCHRPSVCD